MVPEAIPGAWGRGASGTRVPRAGSAAAGTSQPQPHSPQSPRGGRPTDKGRESSHQIPNRRAHLGGRAHLLASHTRRSAGAGREAGSEAGNKPLPLPHNNPSPELPFVAWPPLFLFLLLLLATQTPRFNTGGTPALYLRFGGRFAPAPTSERAGIRPRGADGSPAARPPSTPQRSFKLQTTTKLGSGARCRGLMAQPEGREGAARAGGEAAAPRGEGQGRTRPRRGLLAPLPGCRQPPFPIGSATGKPGLNFSC